MAGTPLSLYHWRLEGGGRRIAPPARPPPPPPPPPAAPSGVEEIRPSGFPSPLWLPVRRSPRGSAWDGRFFSASGLSMSGRRLPARSSVRLRRLGQILLVSAIVASTIFSSNPMGASADSGVCAIPGYDGPGGTLSGIVNTYYPGSATAAASSTSLSISS